MALPPDIEGSESPESADSERAAYWSEFYDRLIAFEEAILGQMKDLSQNMSKDHRVVVEDTNIKPLGALIEDFRRRRDLWQGAERGRAGERPDHTEPS